MTLVVIIFTGADITMLHTRSGDVGSSGRDGRGFRILLGSQFVGCIVELGFETDQSSEWGGSASRVGVRGGDGRW